MLAGLSSLDQSARQQVRYSKAARGLRQGRLLLQQ